MDTKEVKEYTLDECLFHLESSKDVDETDIHLIDDIKRRLKEYGRMKMSKTNNKEIVTFISEIEKQWFLQQLEVMENSEIINYDYEKNLSISNDYDYETITIVRRKKKIKL